MQPKEYILCLFTQVKETQLQKGLNQGLIDTQKTLQGIQGVTGQTFNDIIAAGDTSSKTVKDALLGGSSAIDDRQQTEMESENINAQNYYNQLSELAKSKGDIELSEDLAKKTGIYDVLQQYSQQSSLPEGSQQGMKSGPKLDGTMTEQKPLSANIYNLFDNFEHVFGANPNSFTKSQMYDEDEANRFNLLNQLAGTGASVQAGTRGNYLNNTLLDALKEAQQGFDEGASRKMNASGVAGGSNIPTSYSNIKASFNDYLQSGQDLSKTIYGMSGEEINQKIREQMDAHGMSKNAPLNTGIAAQIQAQMLASKGYEQGIYGDHLGDYNVARSAAESQLKEQLDRFLQSSGYGRKLVIK